MDGLTRVLLLVINLIALLVGLYSISYIKQYTSEEKYYSLFALMIAGMNGMVISGDLFNIFIFLEIATVASYALVHLCTLPSRRRKGSAPHLSGRLFS